MAVYIELEKLFVFRWCCTEGMSVSSILGRKEYYVCAYRGHCIGNTMGDKLLHNFDAKFHS